MKMIEKVARAIRQSLTLENKYNTLTDTQKLYWNEQARSAIEAMREPTEEMMKAFYGDTPVERWLGNDWRDMIDAALKE